MDTDVGRSPLRGSGHSAEPEPISVVSAADAASVPNAEVAPNQEGAFGLGKRAFLEGAALKPPAVLTDLDKCSWRCGWHTARIQRETHPDWGALWILTKEPWLHGIRCWQ
jgi:hypothetical protein